MAKKMEYSRQADLAKGMRVTLRAVQKRISHPLWPFPRVPPWAVSDVPKMKAWCKEHLRANRNRGASAIKNAEERTSEAEERRRLIRARADKLEFERAILQGKHLPKDEVERGRIARIQAVKGELLLLSRVLAAELAGVSDAVEIEKRIELKVDEVLRKFAGETK